MSAGHRIKEFLKHLRHARNRHGVHSPFVYEFVEKGLKGNTTTHPSKLILVTSRHKKLVNKIISYFDANHLLWLTNKEGEQETFITIRPGKDNQLQLKSERFHFEHYDDYAQPELFLFDLSDPADWLVAWEKYKTHFKTNTIILVTSVHHTKDHTRAWDKLCSYQQVKLSLDLYKIGLLFFKDEFKEKQHFVLKYNT